MIALTLSSNRKVRVWLNEMPDAGYSVDSVLERNFEAESGMISSVRCGAIEMYMHTGPRGLYGLLGAKFTPHDSRELLVQVALSSNDGTSIDWSLASGLDSVQSGLLPRYADGILAGIMETEEIHALGAGVLRFDYAAHGQIGSTSIVFQQLGRALVRLIMSENGSMSDEVLADNLRLWLQK